MTEMLYLVKPKIFRSSDGSVGVKKIKPAEAPRSGDCARRLRCTGTPATKAGRFPLLEISGTLAFSPRLNEAGKSRI